jgi:ABC-2 type transport system permease protein
VSEAALIQGELERLGLQGTPGRGNLPERVVSDQVSLLNRLWDVWRYRELLLSLVRKELKVKYKNSVLGFLWSMLNPALTLVIYWFVFQKVLGSPIPLFPVFLMCGLLAYNVFQNSLLPACESVVANAGIVKKVAFPREILALAPLGASLFFFLLQAVVLAIALAIFRVAPAVSYLPLLIPALLALIVFTAGLSILLSAINVYLRDTKHLLEILLMAWFWACPIVYAYETVVPTLSRWHIPLWVLQLNPLTPIIMAFQRAIYGKAAPVIHQKIALIVNGKQVFNSNGAPVLVKVSTAVHVLPAHAGPLWYFWPLLGVIIFSVVVYVASLAVFIRLEGNFAEEL